MIGGSLLRPTRTTITVMMQATVMTAKTDIHIIIAFLPICATSLCSVVIEGDLPSSETTRIAHASDHRHPPAISLQPLNDSIISQTPLPVKRLARLW